MLFSIITPCFNSEKTIIRTIESVLNQTITDYEYIIVDGASSDKTLEIIKSYEEKFKGKLRVISEPDNGIYDAMDKGIKASNGQVIGIVNSDDYLERDALEVVKEQYDPSCLHQILYGMVRFVDKSEQELEIHFSHHRNLLVGGMICHPACFITKSVYDKYGLYSLDFKSASDYDYLLTIAEKDDIVFTPIYHILSNFRLGGISQSILGAQESNLIKYNHKYISLKKYILGYIKNVLKQIFSKFL